jgi:outer membrane protein OmpA-like peptidoglycan-associated protein
MRHLALRLLSVAMLGVFVHGQAGQGPDQAAPSRTDYLTFAQGAIPIALSSGSQTFNVGWEQAVRATDGDPLPFAMIDRATADTSVEITYALPAPTAFDRFAVPNVLETPSPRQTFVKTVEVFGSTTSATDGFVLLASRNLETHKGRGLSTELTLAAKPAVRWVRLRLSGGIQPSTPPSTFEFSEIIGNGRQDVPELAKHFTGSWQDRAQTLTLSQDGAVVAGCYERTGELKGTVTGNILRATGVSRADKTTSAFILAIAGDGSVRGVRSSNGSPFRLYTAPKGPQASCTAPAAPTLGCGAIIHGITFDFDSDVIRPESTPVLDALFKGLAADKSQSVTIEGHTSSEGTDAYNQRLSESRARAVVADLVRRGIPASRLSATGLGETRPIASNNDESGRAMNRRVEIGCK